MKNNFKGKIINTNYKFSNVIYQSKDMNGEIIALLPMKGHSERVPNKNIKLFHGRPLFHAITASLLKSRYIEKVVINTDDKFIKSNAKENFGEKVIIIDRPEQIRGDFVSMNDVINYDLSKLSDYDFFFQTHSTNPLLTTKTIDNACEKYFEVRDEFDSLFAVNRFQTRFYWKDGRPINHDPNKLIRTQDLPIIYEENSNFYIFSRQSFMNNGKKRIGKKPFLFETNKVESIDIDDQDDFIIAKQLYKLKK